MSDQKVNKKQKNSTGQKGRSPIMAPPKESTLLTIREFCEKVGASRQNVERAIKLGKVTLAADTPKRVDWLTAKIEWLENCSPEARKKAMRMMEKKKVADEIPATPAPIMAPPPGQESSPTPPTPPAKANATGVTIAEAERREKFWKAELAQIKAEKERGLLVEKVQVEREAFEAAKRVKDTLLQMPSRISPQVAAETDPFEVENILIKEINNALEDLVKKYLQQGEDDDAVT